MHTHTIGRFKLEFDFKYTKENEVTVSSVKLVDTTDTRVYPSVSKETKINLTRDPPAFAFVLLHYDKVIHLDLTFAEDTSPDVLLLTFRLEGKDVAESSERRYRKVGTELTEVN